MSPVSRGRKAKTKRTQTRSTAPTLNSLYANVIRSFRPVTAADEPLDVEIFTSGLLGMWWTSMPPGEDPDELLAGATDYARTRPTPEAMAFLCAVAELAVTEEIRGAAAAGVTALAARGVARPGWADTIGRASVGDCWRLADVYGDQASLCCEFTIGESTHALMALVDFNGPGPWVKDVWLSDEPATVLADTREQAQAEAELMTLDRIDPVEVRRLLESGLIAADPPEPWDMPDPEDTPDPEDMPDTLAQFRAVALARCRTLPDPGPVADPPEVTGAERAALVTAFLASPEAAALTDRAAADTCAGLIADFEAEHDPDRLLRVSPAKAEIFLMDWVPGAAMLDEPARDAMPAVFLAWTRWAAARQDLPDAALAELFEVVEATTAHFAEAYEGSTGDTVRTYLGELDVSGDALIEALARRTFVAPRLDASIGDEHFAQLNPNDEDERRLLIEGEHPQWREQLDDPLFEGTVDGVNPRLHISIHGIVANQLWDDDPPEAWAAVQRLLDAGADRHEALHELMAVVADNLQVALTERRPADPDAYVRALDRLGRDRAPRPRTARRGRPRRADTG